MKTQTNQTTRATIIGACFRSLLAIAGLCIAATTHAQVVYTSDTTVVFTRANVSGTVSYVVSDGATATFMAGNNAANGGSLFNITGAGASFSVGGTTSAGNYGRVVFSGSGTPLVPSVGLPASAKNGGAISAGTSTAVKLNFTNVTFQNYWSAGHGGAIYLSTGTATFNNVVFQNNGAMQNGGALMMATGATVIINGGTFLNNQGSGFSSSPATASGGGAITTWGAAGAGTGLLTANNVAFVGNSSAGSPYGSGGALYLRTGKTLLVDSTFTNNKASNAGGAITAADSNQVLTIDVTKDTAYTGNMAFSNTVGSLTGVASGTGGGFISMGAATATYINAASGKTLTIGSASDVNADTFAGSGTLNFNTGTNAISNSTIASANATGTLVLHGASTAFSGTSTVANGSVLLGNNNAAFSGKINVSAPATFGGVGSVVGNSNVNAAAGATIQVGTDQISNGLLSFGTASSAVSANNGLGFVGAGNLIGSGTLAGAVSLGGALNANITGATQILTVTAKLAGTGAVTKNGAGMLAFASDNSAFTNSISVNGGAFRMDASGTLGSNVTINNGGALALNATTGAPSILGTLTLNGGKVLYDNTTATSLTAGTLVINAGNTVDISKLVSGTYQLFVAGNDLSGLPQINTTYKNTALTGRTSAAYSAVGAGNGTLQLVINSTSALRTWTGAVGPVWAASGSNWVEGDKQYQDGDSVAFAGTGASAPITIAQEGVVVSDMSVSNASGNFTFSTGSIAADSSSWQGGANATTGRLIKTNSGTLTFQNAGNNFKGGIDISGGVISFNNVAQLGTMNNAAIDQGITFSGNGTLTAAANNLTLTNAVKIAGGATGTIDTQANTFTYTGTLSALSAGATFAKSGVGTLNLTTDNSSYNGATALNAGTLNLTGKLGGAIAINSGATLIGTGIATGNLTANAGSRINIGSSTGITPEVLTVNGILSLNNATVGVKNNLNGTDNIVAGSLTLSGTNIFDFYNVPSTSGTYTLIKTNSAITTLNTANMVTYNSGSTYSNARVDIAYILGNSNKDLLLEYLVKNRSLIWAGNNGNTWSAGYSNWNGLDTEFQGGDIVTFDGVADATHAANRAVVIGNNGVQVADMIVTGTASYNFSGGAITGAIGGSTFTTASAALTMNGKGNVTLANASANSFQGGIIINSGTVTGNALSLGQNVVNVAAAGNFVIDQSGTSLDRFAGVATGNGTTTKTGTGALGLASTGTIATKTFNINQGTFVVSSTGAVKVDTLNVNSGAMLSYRGGNTLTANTFNLLAGGTLATHASGVLSTATFNHAGELRIGKAAASTNPRLSLTIGGNYVGQGGTISLSTLLSTGATDQLIITGNASGNSLLDITHDAADRGVPTTGPGIKVVGILGSDTLDIELAHRVINGIFDYQLYHDDGGVYLRSTISPEIMMGNAAPAVALFAGRASLDSIQNRLGEVRLDPARATGLWVRDTYRSDTLQKSWLSDVKVDTNLFQVGADHAFINPNGSLYSVILGAYYTRTEADGKLTDGSKIENTSNGFGAYAILRRGAFYIEGLVKADYLDIDMTGGGNSQRTKGTTLGGSLEAGYTLPIGRLGTLEPQAQISYQQVDIKPGLDSQKNYTTSSTRLQLPTVRAGLRWYNDFKFGRSGVITPWIRGSVAYDCKGDYSTTVSYAYGGIYYNQSRTFDNELGGPRYIVDAGVTWQIVTRWSVYASGGVDTAPKSESWTASGGIRYAW